MLYRDLKFVFYLILFIVYMNLLVFIQNIEPELLTEHKALKTNGTVPDNITNYDVEDVFERILNKTRKKIKWELRSYNWNTSGAERLEELVSEQGGRPLKTIIISPWRSGSTYIGSLLASLPGVLYYYQPLAHFNDHESESILRKNTENSLKLLKNILKCEQFDIAHINVTNKEVQPNSWYRLYFHDNRMWSYCKENYELYDDSGFREKFCKLFPFHVVKDVHVRLRFVEDILKDTDLNVQVVVVVRDPRAILRSRRTNDVKCTRTICMQAEPICEDMVRDYASARRLLQRYPRRIKILRFEELALSPVGATRDLLQFLKLHMMDAAQAFFRQQSSLDNHTDSWLSEHDAFGWKAELNFQLVEEIQSTCKEAMDLWGYIPAHNWTHQRSDSFHPISNYEVRVQEQNETVDQVTHL